MVKSPFDLDVSVVFVGWCNPIDPVDVAVYGVCGEEGTSKLEAIMASDDHF